MDGSLQNLSPTPMKPDGVSYWDMITGMLKRNELATPHKPLPTVIPDFSATKETKVIWFGHSSYYIQIDGLKILVDPIFSARPSPFSFIGSKQFPGTDFVNSDSFPELDIVLLTHDHYDHLDYPTILELKSKTKHFITSLGVGAHLEKWGIDASRFTELSWGGEVGKFGLKFIATPARHFTGRMFKRNQTLWSGFVLQSSQYKLYLGGDSGYDSHFKEIGEKYGPFDLCVLECGQYNTYWPYIHMFPEQTVQAAIDLRAKYLLPVHWSKFKLAMHNWNDPIIRVVEEAGHKDLKITTPHLGESVILNKTYPFSFWWLD